MKVPLLVLLVTVLASCASMPPTTRVLEPEKYAEDGSAVPGSATVGLFRGTSRAASMATFEVRLDGQRVGGIRRKQYIAIPASPGPHQIFVGCTNLCGYPGINIDIDVKANRTYYFLIENEARFSGMNMSLVSGVGQIDPPFAARLKSQYAAAVDR